MDLQQLISGGNIISEATSRQEIQELLRVVARSLSDAGASGLSPEGRFAMAYDAVLLLSTIPLRCAGYRTRGEGHHWAVFTALPGTMGTEAEEWADYFQMCRSKRSAAIYHQSSVVTQTEADELFSGADEFEKLVRRWLKATYPQYA